MAITVVNFVHILIDKFLFQVKVGQFKITQFGYTQSTTVQSFQNSPVPLSFPCAPVNAADKGVNLFYRQYVRQVFADLWRFQ